MTLLLISGCKSSITIGLEEFCKSEGKKLTDSDNKDFKDYYYGRNNFRAFDIECDKQIYRVYCKQHMDCGKRDKWGNCVDIKTINECKQKYGR